jgi:hypothetical protein
MPTDKFFFDDFFVADDDPGVEYLVMMGGKEVPLRIKKALTLDDIEACKEKAIKKDWNFRSGEMIVRGVDERTFVLEVLLRAIISWPFEYRDGRKVPITREVLQSMMADSYDALARIVTGLISQRREQTDPFEKVSAEAS